MRISPVQTFSPINRNGRQGSQQNEKNSVITNQTSQNPIKLTDMNYGSLLVKKTNPVFTGGLQETAKIISKNVPLDDKLADAFSFLKYGDLIISGTSLKEAQRSLIETLNRLKDNVIKRAFFIEDKNFKGTLAFTKNMLGDTEIINANNKSLFLTTGGKEFELPQHGSSYVIPGDTLKIDDSILKIKDKSDTDLSLYRSTFIKAFNYEQEAQEVIGKQNKKMLSTLFSEKKPVQRTMFSDVIGQDEVIRELKENILYPLRMPRAYEHLDLHHGYIMKGGPGLGKTHTAQAIINEAGLNSKFLNGLELENKYVGESEAAWRNLFDEAIANQPYLIFIDEFDAVGRARGGHDEYGDKVLNQILTCMTDIDANKHDVFVMAATNFFDRLDKALIRSGRFGKILDFKYPDTNALNKLFDHYTKGKPIAKNLSRENIIQKMSDLKCTGADVRRLVTDAYLQGYHRAGITAKLEANTLTDADLDKFKILDIDFENAIKTFAEGKTPDRKSIGFNK